MYYKSIINLSEVEKTKKKRKQIMLILETKIQKAHNEKEKKGYMKNYYCKIKNFVNHLINNVKDLKKVSLNKL